MNFMKCYQMKTSRIDANSNIEDTRLVTYRPHPFTAVIAWEIFSAAKENSS